MAGELLRSLTKATNSAKLVQQAIREASKQLAEERRRESEANAAKAGLIAKVK